MNSNCKKSYASIWWFAFILNYPLLSEITRRFLLYSDYFFIIGDVLVLFTAIFLSKRLFLITKLNLTFYFLIFCLLIWGLGSTIAHANVMIAIVGVRAIFIPLFYLFISTYFVSKYPSGIFIIIKSVMAWCFLISVIAIIQLFFGINHPINVLPASAEGTGIGDYTVESSGLGLAYFFRPTSIFLHTGKFGQVIFTLVLFKWIIIYLCPNIRSRLFSISIVFDIIAIAISGQRSAFLFLTLALFLTVLNHWFSAYTPLKIISSFFKIILFLVFFYILIHISLPSELFELFSQRYVSAFTEVFLRAEDNLILPFYEIVKKYGLSGEGLGYFTLGAVRFGGALLYEAVAVSGAAENSWLRLISEIGLLGAFLFASVLVSILFSAFKKSFDSYKSNELNKALFMFVFFWLSAMSIWAVTHDVFSNSVMMSIGFVLCGPALLRCRVNHPIKNV